MVRVVESPGRTLEEDAVAVASAGSLDEHLASMAAGELLEVGHGNARVVAALRVPAIVASGGDEVDFVAHGGTVLHRRQLLPAESDEVFEAHPFARIRPHAAARSWPKATREGSSGSATTASAAHAGA